MSDDLHSVRHEPHLRPAQPSPPSPAHPNDPNTLERLRDSVASEAHLGGGAEAQRLAWFAGKRQHNTPLGDGLTHLGAAFLGGLFALAGAFLLHLLVPVDSGWGWLNTIVFGPVSEELLKASGAIYLLEKKPYRLHSGLLLTAVVLGSAFIFAVCENLLYVHVYVDVAKLRNPTDFILFRWVAPTGLHLVCSAIASLGLIHIWRTQIQTGKTLDLDAAYPHFATAMAVHGGYNLLVSLLDKHLFPQS